MQLNSIGRLVQTGFLALINFVDDIAIFTLTHLGFHRIWLKWLSTALWVFSIVYWSIRLLRYYHRLQRTQTNY